MPRTSWYNDNAAHRANFQDERVPTEDGEDASAVAEPALAHSVFDAESSADQENIGAAPFHDLPTRRSSPGSLRNARILGTDCARARCAIASGFRVFTVARGRTVRMRLSRSGCARPRRSAAIGTEDTIAHREKSCKFW